MLEKVGSMWIGTNFDIMEFPNNYFLIRNRQTIAEPFWVVRGSKMDTFYDLEGKEFKILLTSLKDQVSSIIDQIEEVKNSAV